MSAGEATGRPPPSRRTWPSRLGAASLLPLVLALVAGLTPAVAQAQATELVSNVAQTDGSTARFGGAHWRAQAFTTGDNSAGYTLSSVDLDLTAVGTSLTVTINASTDGLPGAVVHSLTSPSIGTGVKTFTAGSGATLDASTTYFVVASGAGTSRLRRTDSDDEDSGKASGWSIGDIGHWQNPGAGATWQQSSTQSIKIAVKGTAVADTTAPALSTMSPPWVSGTFLRLTYDEALNTASVPASSAFTVEANDVEVLLATNNAVAIAGNTVTLTLASAVSAGASVTLDYDAPATNPIEDEAGNDAANLVDQPVTIATPGIVLSETSLNVDEDDSGTYTVRLGTQPSADVTVTVARAGGGSEDVTFDTSMASGVQRSLTFTTTNWHVAQTVTVSAATDRDGDDDSATLSHTAGGGGYDAYTADLAVTVTDPGDITAPMLIRALVNGTTVVLTYDEALDESYVPGVAWFDVLDGGTLRAVAGVAVSGRR